MTDNLAIRLATPFPAMKVEWRVGSTSKDKTRGMALAYIDARDVMDRLDDVCGVEGWQNRYSHAEGKTVCEIGIKVGEEWIWKADGAGDTDFEADKGALSAAFKRAGVRWGIGRYLYDTKAPWVEIEPMGKSYRIKDAELARLRKLLSAPTPNARPEAEAGPDGAGQLPPAAPVERAGPPTARKSSAQLKREDVWPEFLASLEECKTSEEVIQFMASIRDGPSRNWPVAWWEAARNEGHRRLKEVENVQPPSGNAYAAQRAAG